jgi:hypothetical protein
MGTTWLTFLSFLASAFPNKAISFYYYGNNYLDMVCHDLNDVFTAELAENAENKFIFIMLLRILPLRAPTGP